MSDVPAGLDEFVGQAPPVAGPAPASAPNEPPGLSEFIAPEIQQEKYGTVPQQVSAGLEATAQGVIGPFAPAIERSLGVSPEGIRGREEANPITHGLGEAAGLVGSSLFGVGEGALLAKAGEGVNAALKLGGEGASALSKIAGGASRLGVESALMQAGDEGTKLITEDPNQSTESAITNIGLSSLIGGGIGVGFGSLSPLIKAAGGEKAIQLIEDFKSRINSRINNPDRLETLADEIQLRHDAVVGSSEQALSKNAQDIQGILGGDQPISAVDAGDSIKQSLISKAEQERESTSALYDELSQTSKVIPVRENGLDRIGNNILKIPEVSQGIVDGTPKSSAARFASNVVDRLQNVKTLSDLDVQIKMIRGDLGLAATQDEKRIAGIIKDKLNDYYERILDEQFSNSDRKDLIKLRNDAKAKYADFAGKISQIGGVTGKKNVGSPGAFISFISDVPSEKLANRLFSENNSEFLSSFKKSFPEEFDTLSKFQKGEIQRSSIKNGVFKPEIAMKQINELSPEVRKTLFNAEELSNLNKAAAADSVKSIESFQPYLKDVRSKFMTNIGGEFKVDHGKIDSYFSGLSKTNAPIKQDVLKNFFEESDKLRSKVPYEPTSGVAASQSLAKLSPGARLADTLIDKGMGKILGAAIGGGAGALIGHPVLGALVGEHALSNVIDSVIPSILKPIRENAASVEGLKAASDMGIAAIKGDSLINKASRAIFKQGLDVIPSHLIPTEAKREKIKDKIDKFASNPEELMNVGGQIGHYMPTHGAALAAAATRATQYLASLKPNTTKLGPLDPDRQPSQVEESKYNRAIDLAEQPLLAVKSIKEGTLTPQDVQTIHTIYPNLYDKLSQTLTNEMINHVSKDNPIPYATRLSLSLFLGQSLDASMTPQAILAAQPKGPQAPQTQQSKGSPKGSMKELAGIGRIAQTQGQSRESGKLIDRA